MSGGGSAGGYVIERSLRFSSASSQYLSRTFTAGGTTNTWSMWIKRGALNTAQTLTGWSNGLDTAFIFGFNSNGAFDLYQVAGGNIVFRKTSSALYRDPSAYMHVVVILDTTNATPTDRVRIYINGGRLNSFSTSSDPSINYNTSLTGSLPLNIGRQAGEYLDGCIAEYQWVTGQALDASSFGEINQTTSQWVAKKYTGTYGTNGFYLDFKDGTSTTTLGYDKSGNNNHWTLTNFTRSAGVSDCWMLDVPAGNGTASSVQPSGNYAVFSPLEVSGNSASRTISHGNLRFTANTTDRELFLKNFPLPTSSSIYMEFVWGVLSGTAFNQTIGVGQLRQQYRANGSIWRDGVNLGTYATLTVGDVVGMLVNTTNNTISFYKNNTLQLTITPTDVLAGDFVYIYISVSGDSVNANFGQRSFAYTPPAGAKALCTANLPTPSIKKPSDHFNVQLSTGANIKADSEALFTNELEWIKDRANANNHQLIDSVRGSSAVLQSNTTAAETTYTAPSGSSVGWVWRASDSAPVTNTNGSISSQVSANVAAGFSVVTYTGNGSTTIGASASTVGHGLGITPQVVLVKRRDATENWVMQHGSLSPNGGMFLNTTNAFTSGNFYFSHPSSSSTFSVTANGSNGTNASTATYVAYCFAEIAGYSKFGSYTGNGSADGTNVTLGFETAFLMIKRTDTTSNWTIFDNQRDGYNVDNDQLYANTTAAEVATDLLDLTSNGFKLRSSDASINANGGTYIFMAFAETPFAYSNAR